MKPPITYIIFEPENPRELRMLPRGRAVDEAPTIREAAEYVADHDKIGEWRICRLYNGPDGEPLWRRLSNADEAEKAHVFTEAEAAA